MSVVEGFKNDVAGNALSCVCNAGDGLRNDSEEDETVLKSEENGLFYEG